MRLWSLHPKYLDTKGLVAVWREGLLAFAVLRGETRGYRHHPQLVRFRRTREPVESIKCYLWHIYRESVERGYHFDRKKIGVVRTASKLPVTSGQLAFELRHLKNKVRTRSRPTYRALDGITDPEPHPLLTIVPGDVEGWERASVVVGSP
jgi:hypothetical protein